jgi:hypothetical protein
MKRIKNKVLLLIIIFVMLLNVSVFFHPYNSKISSKIVDFQNPGEQLKAMGIVKGYKAYGLEEDKIITEGELLALLSRTLGKSEISLDHKIVSETNWFDRFVNHMYDAYTDIKSKIVEYYYNFLSVFPNYQPLPGVKKDSWFFKDALYLKIRGYKFPDNFSLYKEINERELYSMLLDTLSLGDNNENISVPTSISSDDKLKILLVMHGLLPDNFQTNKSVTRGETFNIILNIVKK